MFSEELTGNASRKRAEENRARRRQLKEQQAKLCSSATATKPCTSPIISNGDRGAPCSNTYVSSSVVPPPTRIITSHSDSSIPGVAARVGSRSAARNTYMNQSLSIVEEAEIHRNQRAQIAWKINATIQIQSFCRVFLSNIRIRADFSRLLTKRLSDLQVLSKISHHKSPNQSFTPPVKMTTLFSRYLIYISRSRTLRRSKIKCRIILPASPWITQLIQLIAICLQPGLDGEDTSLDAFTLWIKDAAGQKLVEGILRLVIVSLFEPDSSSTTSRDVLLRFLQTVLGGASRQHSATDHDRQKRIDLCRSMLLSKWSNTYFDPPVTLSEQNVRQCEMPSVIIGESLDLIANLRFYMMYIIAGPRPIPVNAKDQREKCISASGKNMSGSILGLVFDGIIRSETLPERRMLLDRMVTDIFTIPLLTWKMSMESLLVLVSEKDSNMSRQSLFIDALKSFVALRHDALSSGLLAQLLIADSVPMTLCPAAPSQCLLANLVDLAILCPTINATDAAKMCFTDAAAFFTFVTSLLDAVPVGTFSSRESSVEWLTDGKGHHTPIVFSSVILDHCKLLILDSFVRRLFNIAISPEALNIEDVLMQKNDLDLKLEDSLREGAIMSSASTLTSKEARMDRNHGFWDSSKWARKISKGMASIFSSDTKPAPQTLVSVDQESLVNMSSVSRLLAGKHSSLNKANHWSDFIAKDGYDPILLIALCRMFSVLLSRWGGEGNDELLLQRTKNVTTSERNKASPTQENCSTTLLNVLGFSTQLLKASWTLIQSNSRIGSEIESLIDADSRTCAIRELSIGPFFEFMQNQHSTDFGNDGAALLFMFVMTLAHVLTITDDVEVHEMNRPLPVHQLRRGIEMLKKLLYRACYLDDRSNNISSNYFGLALISASSRAMRDLYDRSSRRPLCVPKSWLIADLFEKEIRLCKTYGDYVSLLSQPVLRVCPFLVSFKRRLKLFEYIVTSNRIEIQGVNDMNPFNTNPLKPGIPVRIMRGRLLEDGLSTMNHLGSNMRRRIAVQYVNEAGVQEKGIDAGGLFKEFWTDLSSIAFDPNYALFRTTEASAGNCLYPNPSSRAAHGDDHVILFEFLGRILGKALYEGITIHPRFAHFFLSFLRGDYNYLHMLPDLSTVDPQLYNNIMFLKTFEGDAADLCLTFTVTSDDFGGTREIPLVANGADIEVTSANKYRYIGLVAKYYVVDRVKVQSEAFTRGLWEVIDRSWLRIFNEPELQVLISGVTGGKIDVDDMRANTQYAGGYSGLDRNIGRFWSVVSSLDSSQQSCLLRFVTSCERPPPLGFASLNPQFTIQRLGLTRDDGKLPSASTCFNVLKLPIYSSEKVMKEKLLYAIQSGAGFELT